MSQIASNFLSISLPSSFIHAPRCAKDTFSVVLLKIPPWWSMAEFLQYIRDFQLKTIRMKKSQAAQLPGGILWRLGPRAKLSAPQMGLSPLKETSPVRAKHLARYLEPHHGVHRNRHSFKYLLQRKCSFHTSLCFKHLMLHLSIPSIDN